MILASCTNPTMEGDREVEGLFADAIRATDLDAAWALLEPPHIPVEPSPGRGFALTREHFDAAYGDLQVTDERDTVGRPVFAWPDGTRRSLPIGGPPGEAGIVPSRFHVAVHESAPVRTLVDGVPIPEHGQYTDDSWLGRNWALMTVVVFRGGGHVVAIEFDDGERLEAFLSPDDLYAVFDREGGVAEGRRHF